MLLKIIRNYAQKEHPGWLKFYLDEGPKLVEEIARKKTRRVLSELKQDMVVPVLEYIKKRNSKRPISTCTQQRLGCLVNNAPTIEIKENQRKAKMYTGIANPYGAVPEAFERDEDDAPGHHAGLSGE
jgi:hypothetical protein